MLLGDRSFVERDEAIDFKKTGVFHVLVVAGLHVSALALFLYWLGRKLRLSRSVTMVFTLTLLFAYVAVIEQRPPVLRAALMTAIVVLGGFFYRRLDVLNSAAIAALVLLVARPLAVRDSSFQLKFLAIGCIAGLAAPWLERNVRPYAKALRGWRDVTRDAAHEPRATTPEFLAAVRPRLAIISVGEDNPYGHPNAELLERLASAGVRVLRTDRDGAVHILMDGHGPEVRCFLPCLPAGSDGLQRAPAPDHNKDEEKQ
jgi:ComEC/Rec2-related protein